MEKDTNEPGATQMEANAYQEAHVIKSKEGDAHTVQDETQLKQQGQENTQNAKGDTHNGKYWCYLTNIELGKDVIEYEGVLNVCWKQIKVCHHTKVPKGYCNEVANLQYSVKNSFFGKYCSWPQTLGCCSEGRASA